MKLFIFGATGDLVKKKVLPALEEIKDIEIINIGRKELDDKRFNEEYCKDCSNKLKDRINYKKIDFEENFCNNCLNLLDKNQQNYFYISLPPKIIYKILSEISKLKQKGYKIKVLIEKPFGENLEQAVKLKGLIDKENLNPDIYLADHYLFKEGIINLKIEGKLESLNISSIEKEGINNRIYYDEVGAIKDMVQSHLINIFFKILKSEGKDIINFEIKNVKIGKYKKYKEEIEKESNTETYAKIEAEVILIKDKSKERVKVILETGKRLDKKEISIKINDKNIQIEDRINPYITMLNQFLQGKKENFPTIEQNLNAWELTSQILDYIKEKNIVLEEY